MLAIGGFTSPDAFNDSNTVPFDEGQRVPDFAPKLSLRDSLRAPQEQFDSTQQRYYQDRRIETARPSSPLEQCGCSELFDDTTAVTLSDDVV